MASYVSSENQWIQIYQNDKKKEYTGSENKGFYSIVKALTDKRGQGWITYDIVSLNQSAVKVLACKLTPTIEITAGKTAPVMMICEVCWITNTIIDYMYQIMGMYIYMYWNTGVNLFSFLTYFVSEVCKIVI